MDGKTLTNTKMIYFILAIMINVLGYSRAFASTHASLQTHVDSTATVISKDEDEGENDGASTKDDGDDDGGKEETSDDE